MVNQQLFFTVKLDATNSFPPNMAEVRPIYLKMGDIMRKPIFFCHLWTTKAQISLRIHAVWSAPLLFAAWIVTNLQLKAIHIIHGISNLSVCRYMCRNGAVSPWVCVCMCINIYKHLLLWNHWAHWSQISCGASLGWGNESLFKRSRLHDQNGRHAHIW